MSNGQKTALDRAEGRRRRLGDSAHGEVDYTRALALLEDSPAQRQMLRERLEAEKFNVLTPSGRDDCLNLLAYGCQTFLLDINMGPTRKVEGLETLEDIKRQCPDAFGAIITGDPTYADQAKRLNADWVCGKEPEDIEELVEKLNDVYLRRRLDVKDELTIRKVGVQLRAEAIAHTNEDQAEAAAAACLADLRSRFLYVDARVSEGDLKGAARELVILEPAMRNLASLGWYFGEGFAIVIRALRNSILQHPGQDLTEHQWATWQRVFDAVIAERTLSAADGCRLAKDIDDAGFNTEPPYWPQVTELLDLNDPGLS